MALFFLNGLLFVRGAEAADFSSSGGGWLLSGRGGYALSSYYSGLAAFNGPAYDFSFGHRFESIELILSIGKVQLNPLIEDQGAGKIRHEVSWKSLGVGMNFKFSDGWWIGLSYQKLDNSTSARLTYPDGGSVDQTSTIAKEEEALGLDLRYRLYSFEPFEIDAGVQYLKPFSRNAHTVYPYLSLALLF